MDIQQQISLENNLNKVGKELKVIIDRKEGEYYVGRSEYDSPEVDNEILVRSGQALKPGHFYQVKIEKADYFALFGFIKL